MRGKYRCEGGIGDTADRDGADRDRANKSQQQDPPHRTHPPTHTRIDRSRTTQRRTATGDGAHTKDGLRLVDDGEDVLRATGTLLEDILVHAVQDLLLVDEEGVREWIGLWCGVRCRER